MGITQREAADVATANDSGKQPVVFVHGLWLLAGAWDPWRARFAEHGYATVAVDWPGDPLDVAAARQHPEALAGVGLTEVVDHVIEVLGSLHIKPVVIGHSVGGLLTEMVAGRGLTAAAVAIDPAPFKGVLPLPWSTLKASFPVLGNPGNIRRTVTLTFEQFRYGFANTIPEVEARTLYDQLHVAAPGRPLFQIGFANFTPSAASKVDTRNPDRGPLLVVHGTSDTIVPGAMTHASYKKQRHNSGVTELAEIPDAGHSLVFDSRWTEVAEAALAFLRRQSLPAA